MCTEMHLLVGWRLGLGLSAAPCPPARSAPALGCMCSLLRPQQVPELPAVSSLQLPDCLAGALGPIWRVCLVSIPLSACTACLYALLSLLALAFVCHLHSCLAIKESLKDWGFPLTPARPCTTKF